WHAHRGRDGERRQGVLDRRGAASLLLSRRGRQPPERDVAPRRQHAALGAGRRDVPPRGAGIARRRAPDRGELPLGNQRARLLVREAMRPSIRFLVVAALVGACGTPAATSGSSATAAPPPANEQISLVTDHGIS